MKNRKALLLYEIIFAIGLLIMLYPLISNTWNEMRSRNTVSQYESALPESPDDRTRLIEDARMYNLNLTPKEIPDAFSVREGRKDQVYEALLDPSGNGVMGYIEIPVIDVELPIYHYTTEEVLKEGAGHLFGSDLPVGGKGTHAVIVAHRGLPSAKLFSDLNLVKIGDQFYLHISDEIFAYEVDDIKVVEPTDIDSLQKDADHDYVTLLTCTPYGVNSHRLLVRGHRVKYTEKQSAEGGRSDRTRQIISVLSIVGGGLAAWIILVLLDRRKKRRNSRE